jgi:hypothetical protein
LYFFLLMLYKASTCKIVWLRAVVNTCQGCVRLVYNIISNE